MRPSALLAAAALTAAASPALATWSIVLIDTRTGEIALGSATCLTNFDLRANTPVLIPGVGAATAQSSVDSTGQNRVFIRDRLALGVAPDQILTQLASFDSGHQSRQYGIVDTLGRAATFSGTGDGAYAGGRTGTFFNSYAGQIGPIAYAIQGNVLTGAPVVDQAVQAAIAAPGDLPAKLMAAMQAARSMGGDGRCSCSAGAPTSCGSPPPSFVKSAHIAYMLVARAGDREGSDGVYRAGSLCSAVAAADITGDNLPELFIANATSNTISVLTNITATLSPPPRFPIFAPVPTNYTVASGPRAVAVVDVTNDGIPDLISAGSTFNSLSIRPGIAGGTFGPEATYACGGFPRALAVADFDGVNGRDIAVASYNSNAAAILLNNGSGAFPINTLLPTNLGPVSLVAADVVASPALDLIVACKTSNRLNIFRGNGDGTFTLDQAPTTNATPNAVIAAHFDCDGRPYLAVACDTPPGGQIFFNTPSGFVPVTIPLAFAALDLAAIGGPRPDLIVAGANRFARLVNDGSGGFTLDRSYAVAGAATAVTIADLDGDGDPDIALANNGLSSALVIRNDGPGSLAGSFNDGGGCATGDYFMNFNVAGQSVASPDPVLQLQALYDSWRPQLLGRPDAVQSLAYLSPPQLPSTGAASVMTIVLRDWQGLPITAPIASVSVTHAQGSPHLAAIGPAIPQGNGVYTVTLTAGSAPGIDRFTVRIDDSLRPVTLMPDPALSIYAGSCYANCDGSTTQPLLTVADFSCFLDRFAAADPYANCDGSTTAPTLNARDFLCYLNAFAAGCP